MFLTGSICSPAVLCLPCLVYHRMYCFQITFSCFVGPNPSLNTSLPSPGAWPYSASDSPLSNAHSTGTCFDFFFSISVYSLFPFCILTFESPSSYWLRCYLLFTFCYHNCVCTAFYCCTSHAFSKKMPKELALLCALHSHFCGLFVKTHFPPLSPTSPFPLQESTRSTSPVGPQSPSDKTSCGRPIATAHSCHAPLLA